MIGGRTKFFWVFFFMLRLLSFFRSHHSCESELGGVFLFDVIQLELMSCYCVTGLVQCLRLLLLRGLLWLVQAFPSLLIHVIGSVHLLLRFVESVSHYFCYASLSVVVLEFFCFQQVQTVGSLCMSSVVFRLCCVFFCCDCLSEDSLRLVIDAGQSPSILDVYFMFAILHVLSQQGCWLVFLDVFLASLSSNLDPRLFVNIKIITISTRNFVHSLVHKRNFGFFSILIILSVVPLM